MDLLRYVPGVTFNQSGAAGGVTSLFLRGSNANMNLVVLAQTLERLDRSARAVDAEQYRTVVARLAAELEAAPRDATGSSACRFRGNSGRADRHISGGNAGRLAADRTDAAEAVRSLTG